MPRHFRSKEAAQDLASPIPTNVLGSIFETFTPHTPPSNPQQITTHDNKIVT